MTSPLLSADCLSQEQPAERPKACKSTRQGRTANSSRGGIIHEEAERFHVPFYFDHPRGGCGSVRCRTAIQRFFGGSECWFRKTRNDRRNHGHGCAGAKFSRARRPDEPRPEDLDCRAE